jgi:thiamine-phosphate pyrophosphorylase
MDRDGEGGAALVRIGRRLGRSPHGRKAPANLVLVTDPGRMPDPLAAAARLPRGAAVIYRHFGAPDAHKTAVDLANLARARGLILLIGEDERLAAAVRAQGLHLPERAIVRLARIRARRPRWIITAAVHTAAALRRAEAAGADAVLLSPVFPSRSASAGEPLGVAGFRRLAGGTHLPVIALGGINARTATRLLRSGAAGLAAVEGWDEPRTVREDEA